VFFVHLVLLVRLGLPGLKDHKDLVVLRVKMVEMVNVAKKVWWVQLVQWEHPDLKVHRARREWMVLWLKWKDRMDHPDHQVNKDQKDRKASLAPVVELQLDLKDPRATKASPVVLERLDHVVRLDQSVRKDQRAIASIVQHLVHLLVIDNRCIFIAIFILEKDEIFIPETIKLNHTQPQKGKGGAGGSKNGGGGSC